MNENFNKSAGEYGRKPLTYKQVGENSELMNSMAEDYSRLMKDSFGYRGKASVAKDALSRKYNVSGNAVDYALKEARKEGKISYSRKITDDEISQMVEMSGEKSISEIAEYFGRSKSSVSKAFKTYRDEPIRFNGYESDSEESPILYSIDSNPEAKASGAGKKSWFRRNVSELAVAAGLMFALGGAACGIADYSRGAKTEKSPVAVASLENKVVGNKAPEGKGITIENLVEGNIPVGGTDSTEISKIYEDNFGKYLVLEDRNLEFGIGLLERYLEKYAGIKYTNPTNAPATPNIAETPAPVTAPALLPVPAPSVTEAPTLAPVTAPAESNVAAETPAPVTTPAAAPSPRAENTKTEKTKSYRTDESELNGKVDSSYSAINGDTKGSQQRIGFEIEDKLGQGYLDSNGRWKLKIDYLNQDVESKLTTGEKVSEGTIAITPGFEIVGETFKVRGAYNHAEESRELDGNSTITRNLSESGIDFTQTDTEGWKESSDRTIDALDLEAIVGGFKARAKSSCDRTGTKYSNQMLTAIDFANPLFSDLALLNSVDSETSRKATSELLSFGYQFKIGDSGLLEPTGIFRHSETDVRAEASLNGAPILDEKDSFDSNTIGGSLLYGGNGFAAKGTLLHTTGDGIESNQKYEGAIHLAVAPIDWLALGAGYERVNGGNRGRGILKIGGEAGSNLGSVEKFMSNAEEDDLFPEGKLDMQRFYEMQDRLMAVGEEGIALYGEGGELNDNGGKYWKLGTAMNLGYLIPGAEKVELQTSYEQEDLGEGFETGKIFRIGPRVKLTDSIDIGAEYIHSNGDTCLGGGGDQNRFELGLGIHF
jgi:hypothetical protein